MSGGIKTVVFWAVIAISAVLLWRTISPGNRWDGLAEAWVGIFFLNAAVWPVVTGRRMQVRPLVVRAYTLSKPAGIVLQLFYVAIAGWLLWHGVANFAGKR